MTRYARELTLDIVGAIGIVCTILTSAALLGVFIGAVLNTIAGV